MMSILKKIKRAAVLKDEQKKIKRKKKLQAAASVALSKVRR